MTTRKWFNVMGSKATSDFQRTLDTTKQNMSNRFKMG